MIFGHGRLKNEDESWVDIGGGTGGFVRTVLDDWEPPDLADLEPDLGEPAEFEQDLREPADVEQDLREPSVTGETDEEEVTVKVVL